MAKHTVHFLCSKKCNLGQMYPFSKDKLPLMRWSCNWAVNTFVTFFLRIPTTTTSFFQIPKALCSWMAGHGQRPLLLSTRKVYLPNITHNGMDQNYLIVWKYFKHYNFVRFSYPHCESVMGSSEHWSYLKTSDHALWFWNSIL